MRPSHGLSRLPRLATSAVLLATLVAGCNDTSNEVDPAQVHSEVSAALRPVVLGVQPAWTRLRTHDGQLLSPGFEELDLIGRALGLGSVSNPFAGFTQVPAPLFEAGPLLGRALASFDDAGYLGRGEFRVSPAVCAGDAGCLAWLGRHDVRAAVTRDGDALAVTVTVDALHVPLRARLRPGSVALAVDLDAAQAAVQDGPWSPLPGGMAGQLTLTLQSNGEDQLTADLVIPTRVLLGGRSAQLILGEGQVSYTSLADSSDFKLGLGELRVTLHGAVDTEIRLLSAAVKTHLVHRLGPATITLDVPSLNVRRGNQNIVHVEVNPFARAPVELTVGNFPNELFFGSRMELQAHIDASSLFAPGAAPAWLVNRDYGVWASVGSALRGWVAIPEAGRPATLEVAGGDLRIETVARSITTDAFQVRAGQCIAATDPLTAGEHPLIGRLAFRPCR